MAGVIVSGLAILFFAGVMILTLVATVLYPAFMSIKALESEGDEDDTQWLSYWTVFGFFTLLDDVIGCLLEFIPYWCYIKAILFIWMMLP